MSLFRKFFNKDSVVMFGIIVTYSLVFLPVVFSRVASTEFMEIDPQSIIIALKGLLTEGYNMNDQYHSQYYGWTYFFVNFIVLSVGKLLGLSDDTTVNILIRTVHFIIGGALVSAMYKISRIFFKSVVSLLLVLAFMFTPVTTHFLMTIHPETLGLLCQLLGAYYLIRVYQADCFPWKHLYFAVFYFSLSALCKQSFFIVSVTGACAFFFVYYSSKNNGKQFFTADNMKKLVKKTLGIFLLTFFIVHPYAFFEPGHFLDSQLDIKNEHASKAFSAVFLPWLSEISGTFIVIVNLVLLVLLSVMRRVALAYKVSVVLSCCLVMVLIYNARLWITSYYLFPVYGLLFFNSFYFLSKYIYNKRIFYYVFNFGICFLVFTNLISATLEAHSRFLFDGKDTRNQAWEYILNLKNDVRIAYSPTIAVPNPQKANGCHAWQGCSGYEELETYNPDYIIIVPQYEYFKKEEYLKFIKDKKFKNISKFTADDISLSANCSPLIRLPFLNKDFSFPKYSGCYLRYKEMIQLYNTDAVITGDSISVYQKQ